MRASFKASYCVYGARHVFLHLRVAGETFSKHRVARLISENGIKAQAGYRMRNTPDLSQPDKVWITDILYIWTSEGWLYVRVVLDLFSRKVIGWGICPIIHRELALDAILMAVCSHERDRTIPHSDLGSQYGGDELRRFWLTNNLEGSTSRRGNYWDNAVAESFFSSLKKVRIRKHIYKNRQLATEDVSDYINGFYSPSRRHQHLGGLSPDAFDATVKKAKDGVY